MAPQVAHVLNPTCYARLAASKPLPNRHDRRFISLGKDMSKPKKENYQRHSAPSLVSGFKAAQTSNVIIIDFITALPGETEAIFDSVALTRDVAKNLVKALSEFMEEHDVEEN